MIQPQTRGYDVGTPPNRPIVLLSEVFKRRLSPRLIGLIEALLPSGGGPVVAKCGLRLPPRSFAGRAFVPFKSASKDDQDGARTFAKDIVSTYRPSWIIACSLEADELTLAFEGQDVPVVVFLDEHFEGHLNEVRIHKVMWNAAGIVIRSADQLDPWPDHRWAFESRANLVDLAPGAADNHSPIGRNESLDAEEFTASANLLHKLGRSHASARAHASEDLATILNDGTFDKDLYLRPSASDMSHAEAAAMYLRTSRAAMSRDRVNAGRLFRRPKEGFNPLIYSTDNPRFDETRGEDPLAHYIRSGAPIGRWVHQVIKPTKAGPRRSAGPAALHGHFHYPELLEDLLDRLARRADVDLFLTTTSDDRKHQIEDILQRAGSVPKMVVTLPNRGRDIAPFLHLLQSGAFDDYHVVGHVHGKKSLHFEDGDVWRDFLWDHLIGGRAEILDPIMTAFDDDHKLGLVFAEEPNLEGWEENFEFASALAARMGIKAPLPNHLEYPSGTMFWARPQALRPLLDLGLREKDYPDEPIAADGTILHALELVIPFAIERAGYHYATTRVPGSVR